MEQNPVLALAPMVRRTDRHCRALHRIIAPKAWLYTEMIVADSIVHGPAEKLLDFAEAEHPIAVQLAGRDPSVLAQVASLAERRGFDAVNLNLGCPADGAKSGTFGACLMKWPQLVASIVDRLKAEVSIPVTVKCRSGVDDLDDFEFLQEFVGSIADAGVDAVIVHARKAVLNGFSTRQNLRIPPLDYERVRRVKRAFPTLEVHLNGGLESLLSLERALAWANGVMIGRAAYREPLFMSQAHTLLFGASRPLSAREVLMAYLPYVEYELLRGTRLHRMTRHLTGLIRDIPGSARIRRHLGVASAKPGATSKVIEEVIQMLETPENG